MSERLRMMCREVTQEERTVESAVGARLGRPAYISRAGQPITGLLLTSGRLSSLAD